MLTFLTMLACSQPEAAEPPLPEGAAEFRSTLQYFNAIRMWIRAPEFNGLPDGPLWFGFEVGGLDVENQATPLGTALGLAHPGLWGLLRRKLTDPRAGDLLLQHPGGHRDRASHPRGVGVGRRDDG